MKKIIIIFIFISLIFPLSAQDKLNLRIGMYENSPKIYTDNDGKVSGFWADIVNYIAEKEGWSIEWIHGDWEQCLQRLETNEIDILVDVGVTPDRQKRFLFSNETVLLSWTRLYTQEGVKIKSLMDLEGQKIAGLKGSFNINGPEGLRDIIEKFGLECKIVELNNYSEVFEAIQNKEVFAGITNKDFGEKHEMEYKIERTPIIFQPARMQFAFPKYSKLTPMLIDTIDNNLVRLKADNKSIYYRSMEKHLGERVQKPVIPYIMKVILVLIFIVIVVLFIFIYLLRYKIKQKENMLKIEFQEQILTDKLLQTSSKRFKILFDNSPVPIWEEDVSELYSYLNQLKKKGINNFRDYLDKNPEEISKCAQKIEVTDINYACLKLYQAESKKELLGNLDKTFTEISYNVFKEVLIAFAEGKIEFNSESEVVDLKGQLIYVDIKIVILENENSIVKALVTTIDITERKKIEMELDKHRQHLEELVEIRTKSLKESQQSLVYLLEDMNETREKLEEKNAELEEFNELFVDREFRIKELKDKIRELEGKNS